MYFARNRVERESRQTKWDLERFPIHHTNPSVEPELKSLEVSEPPKRASVSVLDPAELETIGLLASVKRAPTWNNCVIWLQGGGKLTTRFIWPSDWTDSWSTDLVPDSRSTLPIGIPGECSWGIGTPVRKVRRIGAVLLTASRPTPVAKGEYGVNFSTDSCDVEIPRQRPTTKRATKVYTPFLKTVSILRSGFPKRPSLLNECPRRKTQESDRGYSP